MLQFLAGFTLGNVVGMYLAQNYDVPNIAKKIEAFKKDVEAKKKPPEWAERDHVATKDSREKLFILHCYGIKRVHMMKGLTM